MQEAAGDAINLADSPSSESSSESVAVDDIPTISSGFLPGRLVLASMKGYPLWPGKEMHPLESENCNPAIAPEGKVWVYFFGDGSNALMNVGDVQDWDPAYWEKCKANRKLGKFKKSLENALEEIRLFVADEPIPRVEKLLAKNEAKAAAKQAAAEIAQQKKAAARAEKQAKAEEMKKEKQEQKKREKEANGNGEGSKEKKPRKPRQPGSGQRQKQRHVHVAGEAGGEVIERHVEELDDASDSDDSEDDDSGSDSGYGARKRRQFHPTIARPSKQAKLVVVERVELSAEELKEREAKAKEDLLGQIVRDCGELEAQQQWGALSEKLGLLSVAGVTVAQLEGLKIVPLVHRIYAMPPPADADPAWQQVHSWSKLCLKKWKTQLKESAAAKTSTTAEDRALPPPKEDTAVALPKAAAKEEILPPSKENHGPTPAAPVVEIHSVDDFFVNLENELNSCWRKGDISVSEILDEVKAGWDSDAASMEAVGQAAYCWQNICNNFYITQRLLTGQLPVSTFLLLSAEDAAALEAPQLSEGKVVCGKCRISTHTYAFPTPGASTTTVSCRSCSRRWIV